MSNHLDQVCGILEAGGRAGGLDIAAHSAHVREQPQM